MRKTYLLLLPFILLVSCTTPAPAVDPTQPPTETAAPPTATETTIPTNTPTTAPTNTPEPTNTPQPTDTPEPTETAAPQINRFPIEDQFTIYGDQPAVPNDNLGPTGQQFTDPGAVLYHDGQFHMFHNAFTGWPAPVQVMYSTSPDGLNWTLAQETPIFEGNDLDYAGVAALASSAIVLEDGTWVLYFYTWEDQTWPVSGSTISLATAPNPTGPWTARQAPILSPGPAGSWDDLAVRAPSVVPVEDGYVMFYAGNQRITAAIGRAFSEDGLNWTKYDDPTTADDKFAASDPILTGSGSGWDRNFVYQPRVRKTDDGWVMLYTSSNSVGSTALSPKHGLAYSPDGQEWTRSETPIFRPNQVNNQGRNIWYTELEQVEGTYYIYLELGTGGQTEIYVATFDASLLP